MCSSHVIEDGSFLKMTGYSLRKTHCRHSNVFLGASQSRAFKLVDYIAFLSHILSGGGVVLHHKRGCFPVLVVYYKLDLIFIVGRGHVLTDDVSDGFFILFVVTVVLTFVVYIDMLWSVVVYVDVEVTSIPLVHHLS